MAVNPTLDYALPECFRKHPDISAFSDFTVIVESSSFQCHKVILNACSKYFQALFKSQMNEDLINLVELQGVKREAFAVIFDAVYKGIDFVRKENIIEVWHASVLLQIEFMVDVCERFVNEIMTPENCFDFYILGIQFKSKKVKAFSRYFVCKHFELCKAPQNFERLPLIEVYNILKDNNLEADSEDSVVDVILRWINYNQTDATSSTHAQTNVDSESSYDIDSPNIVDRRQYLVKLLSVVRLCLASIECLRKLFQEDLIMSCRPARDLIFSAIEYKLSVRLRHDSWPDAAVHRATSKMKHAMVFAAGQMVNVYLLKDGSTQEYAKLPNSQAAGLVVFDNVLYMIDCNNTIQKCLRNKHWETLLKNNVPVTFTARRNMLLSLGSYIYCFDAMNRCIQRVNCTDGCPVKWEMCLKEIDYVKSMIRYKEHILLFGTCNNTEQTNLLCPDLHSYFTVATEQQISGPLDGLVSFEYNENVFVLQKNGKLWEVSYPKDLNGMFRFVNELWTFLWEIYGCVVYQKQLFIFGGKNCPHKPVDFQWPTSLPGIIDKVKVIQIESDTACLPIVVA